MIQVLAGLKAIPVEYEEAAKIGGNKWQMFWRVRFPLCKNAYRLVGDYCRAVQFK